MARLFSSGFELNSTTTGMEFTAVGSGASFVIAPNPVRSGNYALRCDATLTTASAQKAIFSSDQNVAGFQRVYINIASFPTNNSIVLKFSDSTLTSMASLRLTPTGELQIAGASGVQVSTLSSVLSLNTWYMVELSIDATTNPGSIIGRLNGTQFASGANSAQGSWSNVNAGLFNNNGGVMFVDDWAVNDATGTFQNSFPGPGKIVHLAPNGKGDANGWTAVGGASPATTWQAVAEAPADDASTAARSGAAGSEDYYTVPPSSIGLNDTVTLVQVSGRMAPVATDATANMAYLIKKVTGGTVSVSPTITPDLDTSVVWKTHGPFAYATYPLTRYQDPDNINWTPATIRTMQIGLRKVGTSANQMRVTMAWALVEYVEGTPITPPLSNTTLIGVS